ncbi:hypothetical protein [Deinococcus kurensis]|uniref:hypothetical protein n=1 Tax=Deinococcus kurensis TaxID=2662757 RepID=UPI0012D2CB9C|nr:hypothetical protein [Deinococcus kurensis]
MLNQVNSSGGTLFFATDKYSDFTIVLNDYSPKMLSDGRILEIVHGVDRVVLNIGTVEPGNEFAKVILGTHALMKRSSGIDSATSRKLVTSKIVVGIVFHSDGSGGEWHAALIARLLEAVDGLYFDGNILRSHS